MPAPTSAPAPAARSAPFEERDRRPLPAQHQDGHDADREGQGHRQAIREQHGQAEAARQAQYRLVGRGACRRAVSRHRRTSSSHGCRRAPASSSGRWSPVNTSTSAWPPICMARSCARCAGSMSTATGKRWAWRSQSRLFSTVGRVPGGACCPAPTPRADAAHPALEHLARQDVEDDGRFGAGDDVAEVVLGHVRTDPEVVHGDQGHRRRAGLQELADIGAQVGHAAAGGRDARGCAAGPARPSRPPSGH